MIGGVGSATGAVHTGMHAIRKIAQYERDSAAIAQHDLDKQPRFTGNGSNDPHRGQVVDITA